ncbi:MAG: prolipoprotein diacylglyceryl transferase [Gammaproteobacteria bacterium]|nr:prolipoprotein diacylglyceryl transferase [Gammaproteobacteria bacterium]
MINYPEINPVAIDLGFAKVHWYGLMYLIGFLGSWWLGVVRAKQPDSDWNKDQVADVIFYGALGVILGGRIGYILFYNFSSFIDNPIIIFKIWQGGMSFHGGMLGVFIALYLFGRKTQKTFFQVSDFIAPMVPIGLGAGRIGNFINKELPGRMTESDVPWAMDFGDHIARHPSSLYQAFTEGLLLFVILFYVSSKSTPRMMISAIFMICYGSFRFVTEFFRMPDEHLGFVAFGWLTKGQQLSIPMVLFGLYLLYLIRKNKTSEK